MRNILFLLVITIIACNKESERSFASFQDYAYACEIFDLGITSYAPDVDIYFKFQLIVFDSEPLEVTILSEIINNMYNPGGFYFKVQEPIYASMTDSVVSYLDKLDNYYTPGEIRCLVFPKGIKMYEERNKQIQGAADGIPSIRTPYRARPTFFMRRESLQTDITNHELGHVLGLPHTFKDGDIENKGHSCATGDKIPTTTTPHPAGGIFMESCEYFLPKEIDKLYTEEEKQNMVDNPMSYSPEYCMKDLLPEQFQMIRKVISVNSRLQDCIIRTENAVNVMPQAQAK